MRCYVDESVLPDILKALQSLETSGIAYEVMLHHNPVDLNLRQHRCEKFKTQTDET